MKEVVNSYTVLKPIRADSVVIGGGISGLWTAYKLQSLGLNTVLIYYNLNDRGGFQGSSKLSVGAINTISLNHEGYDLWLKELGLNQSNPTIADAVKRNLEFEINELKKIVKLKKINLGYSLDSISSKHLLNLLKNKIETLGVQVIKNGWVVKINASESECSGIQYQIGSAIGLISSGSIVIASGGYSAIQKDSLKSGTYGSIHGKFLQEGGLLSNMEFIFKHGYGKPDLGELIPTEELPGAEIYENNKDHVEWLEKELFEGRGTKTHFQAFLTWNKNSNSTFYVDFTYREFHKIIKKCLDRICHSTSHKNEHEKNLKSFILDMTRRDKKDFASQLVDSIIKNPNNYNYSIFKKLKQAIKKPHKQKRFKVSHLSYFSMGGLLHNNFKTNLLNVFVTGEAMHDFGAHRVGGLPWALYLSSAIEIAHQIQSLKDKNKLSIKESLLIKNVAQFDMELFKEIKSKLNTQLKASEILKSIDWVQSKRKDFKKEQEIDDCYSYLLVAESILISSLYRKESRGNFIRPDFKSLDNKFDNKLSIVSLEQKTKETHLTHIDNSISNIERLCH